MRMFGNIKFVAEKRPYTLHLHDALPFVHDRNLVLRHKLYAALSSDEFNFAHKKSRDSLESLLLKYYDLITKFFCRTPSFYHIYT